MHEFILKWFGLVAVICGGIYGLWEYSDGVEKQFRQPFWEKQLDYYFRASSAAAKIAISCDEEIFKTAEFEFYELFYGPLALVEDDQVESAMVAFHRELQKTAQDKTCESAKLKSLSLKLAWTLRHSIGQTWQVRLPALERKQNEINQ